MKKSDRTAVLPMNRKHTWKGCKHLLCVRLDNMGDLLMSAPAIRALRETFECRITLLTSSKAAPLAPMIQGIDEVMTVDMPWAKTGQRIDHKAIREAARVLRQKHYDGAVIFTTYSQSPLPAAVLLFEAGITRVLAYCRENPHGLVSHWLPEREPHHFIRHQVERDLALVHHVGAHTGDDRMQVRSPAEDVSARTLQKLWSAGLFPDRKWIVVHTGVNEPKREYAMQDWIAACQQIIEAYDVQIVLTGARADAPRASSIARAVGPNAFCVAGDLSLPEFICTVGMAHLVISVNTVTAHLAAALNTPVIVLYALTNPQHAPWKGHGFVLPFSVDRALQSRNELLRYTRELYYPGDYTVSPWEITRCAGILLSQDDSPCLGQLVTGERQPFNPEAVIRTLEEEHFYK